MFFVRDGLIDREAKIRSFLNNDDCAISVVLAAVHFEWTISRAILALGKTPTKKLREEMEHCTGLGKYQKKWKKEVMPGRSIPALDSVIVDWGKFEDDFQLRHVLVHGRRSCTLSFASRHVETLLKGANDVQLVCNTEGVDIYAKLKSRRKERNI